jgi:hypothetical protein
MACVNSLHVCMASLPHTRPHGVRVRRAHSMHSQGMCMRASGSRIVAIPATTWRMWCGPTLACAAAAREGWQHIAQPWVSHGGMCIGHSRRLLAAKQAPANFDSGLMR